MLNEAYERMKVDINASHILISVDEKSSKKDRENVYNELLTIRTKITDKIITFEDAAIKYSDDKSAINNGGNLGYFTAFMMVYNFENTAYNTEINEISMPIKTKYGYHLIKVNDRRDAVGNVKIAHIMFKTGQGANNEKVLEAKKKIIQAKKLIENGEDFSDVAERFSEDRSTAVKGGVLPSFGVGKMVPKFEKIAFSLKDINDVSEPFNTNYGWHILKLIEKEPVPDFASIKSDLENKIKRDSRSELSEMALYTKLRKIYKVKNIPDAYNAFRKVSAIQVGKGNYQIKSDNFDLLKIEESSISSIMFSEYILENQYLGSDIDELYTQFVNQELLKYEESQLENKYAEYKALYKEYKEGILLFDLTNKKVWTKAVEDSIGLNAFFINNQSLYKWDDRIDATIYTCKDLKTAKSVKKYIYKKRRNLITDNDILQNINKNSALSLQIESGKFSKNENKYIDRVKNYKKGFTKDLVLEDGSYIIIDIHNILPASNKIIKEVKGKVISDYQSELDKNWVSKLKDKYSVKINNKVLYSLIK
jgi:peptidyl-prolyl cis-trans isomerase SurA